MTRTHNNTMAALAAVAAERFGDAPAAQFQLSGEWQTMSFNDVWDRVRDLALGLCDLGIVVGDRVAILANTRVEFTIANLAVSAAGAIAVPVYPSSSADECHWVVGDSGSKVIFCENADQVAKVDSVRTELPDLAHVVVIDGPADGALSLDDVADRGRGRDDGELSDRLAGIGPDDPCLIIYTSGTTGRPKGTVLTNKGFAAGRTIAADMDLFRGDDVCYLYLPLAHVFGQLVQAVLYEVGGCIAYWGGDPNLIVGELAATKPSLLPSVPRIFEKVYSLAMSFIPAERKDAAMQAIQLGVKVRQAQQAGAEVSAAEREAFDRADSEMFSKVRDIFGGNVRLAVSGAAPIAPEILEFFYASGVPVMEGWGMTETTAIGTINTLDDHKVGTIGKPVAGADIRIAADGEIEIGGEFLMTEYWKNPQATAEVFTDDGYLKTGDLGSIDEDGFVRIIGRNKDIIITAGGKNLTPANLEGDLRRSKWISQVVMFADRKPYPVAVVTLDLEVVVPWADSRGYPNNLASLASNAELISLIQADLDTANERYARVEQIKRFKILERDFTIESGELTPSLKLKRNVVFANCAEDFESLYG